MGVAIYRSARKHGIRERDIIHAIEHAVVVKETEREQLLHLGPDRSGNLLEVVTYVRDDGTQVAVHAMKIRKTYQGLLPGGERHGT